MNRHAVRLLAGALALCLAGCERAAQDMYDQARGKPYQANRLFADGSAMRAPPGGTVPHAAGNLAGSSGGRRGAQAMQARQRADAAPGQPYPLSAQLLRRGRERYDIYCLPCHSPVGDGDGRIARRGFPAPPTYHSERLRQATDRHLYDVITHGYGVMYGYGNRLEPADRWAIVAFVRALQLSQHADLASLPPPVREAARAHLPAPESAP